jgi:GNAT superfamily N-acetyltransferase
MALLTAALVASSPGAEMTATLAEPAEAEPADAEPTMMNFWFGLSRATAVTVSTGSLPAATITAQRLRTSELTKVRPFATSCGPAIDRNRTWPSVCNEASCIPAHTGFTSAEVIPAESVSRHALTSRYCRALGSSSDRGQSRNAAITTRTTPAPASQYQRRTPSNMRGRISGSLRQSLGYRRVVIIRDAVDSDWPRIWPFFSAIVAAGETYAYPEDLTSETARPLWMEVPPAQTVVAAGGDSADAEVLGSAKFGPNRPGRGAHIATASFMVNPAAQGRGVGRALGAYALDWARQRGYHGMQFNAVVETNEPAVHLWQALGFQIIGTVPEAFRHRTHGLVGLHVMYQRLD